VWMWTVYISSVCASLISDKTVIVGIRRVTVIIVAACRSVIVLCMTRGMNSEPRPSRAEDVNNFVYRVRTHIL
jgi:hypothetical protein